MALAQDDALPIVVSPGMLDPVEKSVSVRVSARALDGLRDLAHRDGLSLDKEIQRLVSAERQRRIGASLAAHGSDDDEQAWLDMAARTITSKADR